jgi:glycosyltransferase involved in cell wall biosynthesis
LDKRCAAGGLWACHRKVMLRPIDRSSGETALARPRFCFVVSTAMTAKAFLRDQLKELAVNYELHVLANVCDASFLDDIGVRASFKSVPLERNISPWSDFRAFFVLLRAFSQIKPHAVLSVTPKAGLLAMAAAFLAGVPCRIHTFTGQVWANKRGAGRWILSNFDRLTALFAGHVLVDSPSQRHFLLANRVVSPQKSTVLGHGSVSGVDLKRFKPDPDARAAVRAEFGLAENVLLFLYVGRLNRDKGIPELLEAFARYSAGYQQSRLLLVGPDEGGMDRLIDRASGVLRVGYTDQPERFMASADILVLPSHREGFGSTVIEAAACGLPAVASRIYGLTDAIIENETGILHEPGNVEGIASALVKLSSDSELRRRLGDAALVRAKRDFAMEDVTRKTIEFYRDSLASQTSAR